MGRNRLQVVLRTSKVLWIFWIAGEMDLYPKLEKARLVDVGKAFFRLRAEQKTD